MKKINLFVSYSRNDLTWLNMLEPSLERLKQNYELDIFIDKKIGSGSKWRNSIRRALKRMDMAILLVSPAFVESNFITTYELPRIRKAARNRNVLVIPIFLSKTKITNIEWLLQIQSPNPPNRPFEVLTEEECKIVLDTVEKTILEFISGYTIPKAFFRRYIYNWRFSFPFSLIALALMLAIGFSWWLALQPIEFRQLATIFPVGLCRSEPRGSSFQLFENGWLISHHERNQHIAIVKGPEQSISWEILSSTRFTKSIPVECPKNTNEDLLDLGFKWTYCRTASDKLRKGLGKPATKESKAWIQYQPWSGGILLHGIPGTMDGRNMFQILYTAFLAEGNNSQSGTGRIIKISDANSNDAIGCAALWYPARKDQKMPLEMQSFSKSFPCKNVAKPDLYISTALTCSLVGF